MPKTRRRRKRRKTRFKRRKKSKIRRRRSRRRSRRRRRGGRPVHDAGDDSDDDSVSSQSSVNFTPVQREAFLRQEMELEAWENTLRNFLNAHRPPYRPPRAAGELQDRVNLEQEILNTMRQGGGDGWTIARHLLRGELGWARAETMRTAAIEEMALERARLSRRRRRARAARLP
jgi:hypothetical protein